MNKSSLAVINLSRFVVVSLLISLFTAETALAQGQPQQIGVFESLMKFLPLFIVIFAVMYFMIILPQKRRQREQMELLSGLKKGEMVVTYSGIIGKIAAIEEGTVVLEVCPNVKIKFEKSSIVRKELPVTEKNTADQKK